MLSSAGAGAGSVTFTRVFFCDASVAHTCVLLFAALATDDVVDLFFGNTLY